MFTSLFLRLLNKEASSPGNMPERVIESLGMQEGPAIADFGSGGGYFTLKFAKGVGSSGTVYAIDVKTKYLDFIRRSAEKEGLKNVICVPAAGENMPLPEAGLDLIFARNVYHHLSEPARSFRELKRFLKPGGKVAIIEHKPQGGLSFTGIFKHHTARENIVRDMEGSGYYLAKTFDFLPGQTFSLFRVK